MNVEQLVNRVLSFTETCRIDANTFRFASTPGGPETLYGSCFAVMILHYLKQLDALTQEEKLAWAAYLNAWQDPETGYFLGPELVAEELKSRKHSYEHVSQHLAVHVLPALRLLGSQPQYPLTFAHQYLDPDFLQSWLDARDWHDAWLEGNNLLFVGQFLVYLRDNENMPEAQNALDLFFSWLDKEVDPATGLWGSNGFCSNPAALYGGYHQLLVYYYENHPVNYPERLVDVALSMQHADGGFDPSGGGGACKDADTVDILVNMYKAVDYKRPQIRIALRKGIEHILKRQMPDGGFVYYLDKPFMHMGIQKTASPANQSNLFPTWFRIHTLALISQILTDEWIAGFDWGFNESFSMGWHDTWDSKKHAVGWRERQEEVAVNLGGKIKGRTERLPGQVRRAGGKVKRRLLKDEAQASQ